VGADIHAGPLWQEYIAFLQVSQSPCGPMHVTTVRLNMTILGLDFHCDDARPTFDCQMTTCSEYMREITRCD